MAKKDKRSLGSYLGSPESFSSQFFSNVVDDIEIRQRFAQEMLDGVLVHYVSPSMPIDNADGFICVLYTRFGAIVSGPTGLGAGATYVPFVQTFHRTLGSTYTGVRYDTLYVENAVMASWTAFLNYVRTSGITDTIMKTGLISGQGLLYNMPTIAVSMDNTWLSLPTAEYYIRLQDYCRGYVYEMLLKERQQGKRSDLSTYAQSIFSRSQSMWPEMKGLWTRFVDNVGVYLPNFLDVDLNLTNDLGQKFVGCYLIRVPSSASEGWLYKFNWLMTLANGLLGAMAGGSAMASGSGSSGNGMIEVPAGSGEYVPTISPGYSGYGASQAISFGRQIGNTLLDLFGPNRNIGVVRVVMPRIRGFGRQYTPDMSGNVIGIPSYDEAESVCNALFGVPTEVSAAGLTGKVYQYYQKRVLLTPKSEWDAFVNEMNKVVAAADSATGQLQGFPY